MNRITVRFRPELKAIMNLLPEATGAPVAVFFLYFMQSFYSYISGHFMGDSVADTSMSIAMNNKENYINKLFLID